MPQTCSLIIYSSQIESSVSLSKVYLRKSTFGLSEQVLFQVIKSDTRPVAHGWCYWLPWLPQSPRAQLQFTGRSMGTMTPAASVATLTDAHPCCRANVKTPVCAEGRADTVKRTRYLIYLEYFFVWLSCFPCSNGHRGSLIYAAM